MVLIPSKIVSDRLLFTSRLLKPERIGDVSEFSGFYESRFRMPMIVNDNSETVTMSSNEDATEVANNEDANEQVHGNGESQPEDESAVKQKLRYWLNRHLRIKMTDGRVLTGAFLCTDRDANVILGACSEFLSEDHKDARALGLVMVPGRHIVSIHLNT